MLRRAIVWYLRVAIKLSLVCILCSIDIRAVPAVLRLPRYYWPPLHPRLAGFAPAWWHWAVSRSMAVTVQQWLAAWNPPHLPFLVLQVPFLILSWRVLAWRRRSPSLRPAAEATHGSARWRPDADRSRTLRPLETETDTE